MTSISTGVDLVEIERLKNLNVRIKERFLKRVYTSAELEESDRSEERLAGKFAAKEAAAKALGCGIGVVSWQDLEILHDAQGRPVLTLHNQAGQTARAARWTSWSLSISHTRTHAMAVVCALIDEPGA
jgi:holo-[acyl-carrier protein] synthase